MGTSLVVAAPSTGLEMLLLFLLLDLVGAQLELDGDLIEPILLALQNSGHFTRVVALFAETRLLCAEFWRRSCCNRV